MNRSATQILLIAADALWRRRFLLILPFLVFMPLGLAFATFGPIPYVAKCLLLLQENARTNPLASGTPAYVNMNDRILGLQALLKSDRVLGAAMTDILGTHAPTDPEAIAAVKQSLADALTIELLGNDILRLQLKGNSPTNLGRKLEAIVSRFVEALLPAKASLSAIQVLENRRNDSADVSPPDPSRSSEDLLKRETSALVDQQMKLQQTKSALELLSRTISGMDKQPGVVGASGRPSAAAPGSKDSTDSSIGLREAEAQYSALEKEMQLLANSAEQQQRRVDELRRTEQQVRPPAGKPYPTATLAAPSPAILTAPERIKLIDYPRDPVFTSLNTNKVTLVALAGLLLTTLGLVVLAELLDTRVRRQNQFEDLTGLPVLARLPASPAGK